MPRQTVEHTSGLPISNDETPDLSRRRLLKTLALAGGLALTHNARQRAADQATWSSADPNWAEHGPSGGLRGRNESRVITQVERLAGRVITRVALGGDRHENVPKNANPVPGDSRLEAPADTSQDLIPQAGQTAVEEAVQPPIDEASPPFSKQG